MVADSFIAESETHDFAMADPVVYDEGDFQSNDTFAAFDVPEVVQDVETAPDSHPDDSLAARLQRIRSVVGQSDFDDDAEYEEDVASIDEHSDVSAELNALLAAESEDIAESTIETGAANELSDMFDPPEDTVPEMSADENSADDPDASDTEDDTISQLLADAVARGGATAHEVAEMPEFEEQEVSQHDTRHDDSTVTEGSGEFAERTEPDAQDTAVWTPWDDASEDEAGAHLSESTDDAADEPELIDSQLDGEDADVPEEELLAEAFKPFDTDMRADVSNGETDAFAFENAESEAGDETFGETEPFVLDSDNRIEELSADEASEPDDMLDNPAVSDADARLETGLSPEDEADLQRELAAVATEEEPEHETAPVHEDQSVEDIETFETGTEIEDTAAFATDEPVADDQDASVDGSLIDVETEVQAEKDADADIADADESVEEEQSARAPRGFRRGLARLLGGGKRQAEEEERIFDEADNQLGDRDSSMRRTAIQHLRAAVAATRAEKSAGVDIDPTTDEAPYRSDLARAVQPRRPEATAAPKARPQRPVEQKPAPLKLVDEQRIDVDRSPILPRRIAASDAPDMPSSSSDASGFNEFAQERGATELSELLEAAAAYMSDVEGREEFSRPMLMNKLKEVKHDSYSREDGLRSFGKLLRTGKLRKIKGGRFSVTDETEYRAQERNAG
ncbi:MAG: hypothetical protein AAGA28_14015 [Pseudomonadota bacterium]